MTQAHPRTFLIFYIQTHFWSMGEGKGTPSFVRTLNSLAERGHSVHVFMPAESGIDAPYVDSFGDVVLHHEPSPGRLEPRASLPVVKRVLERATAWYRYQRWARTAGLRIARELNPDLVISLGTSEAPASRAVAEAIEVPNVVRLYGSWLPIEKSVRYYLNFPALAALRTPAVAYLITDDGSMGDRIAYRAGVPEDRVFFPRNGLDLEQFHPDGPPGERERVRAEFGIAPDAPVIVSATRLNVEKKVERILGAIPAVAREIPNVVCLVLGDGDKRADLERLVETLGVQRNVIFAGAVANSEIPRYLRAGDVLVSLLDRTNTNNPTLEAMAVGLPIVALETGATREVVEAGVSGWILDPSALPELPSLLVRVLSDPDALRRAGANARARIERLVRTPKERLDFEVDLYEAAAERRPLPTWDPAR